MKACIIGVSGYGAVHYELLRAAQASGDLEIVGATVINQHEETEKCARLRESGCRIFEDDAAMFRELSGMADFCMIPTGIPLHRPMTVAALEAGMNVFLEKPAAGSWEDVQAMREVARKTEGVVVVGYQHLYSEAAMETKRHLLQGLIGERLSIKCLGFWPRGHAYYTRNGWAGKRMVGGMAVNDSPYNNAMAHELMMMLFLAGSDERKAATPVSVEATLYRVNDIETVDTAAMHIETEEGIPIRFYCTHACANNRGPEIHVQGSKGSLVMTHQGTVFKPDNRDPVELAVSGDAKETMFHSALDVFRGGDSFVCDLDMASRQTWVVDTLQRTCKITTLPGKTIEHERWGKLTVIPGSEDKLRTAFKEERLMTPEELTSQA